MAVSHKYFGQFFLSLANKEVDLNSDTIKWVLVSSGYTFDQDGHNYYNDVTNELPTAGGYTVGGATMGSPTITYTGGSNTFTFDGADVAWTGATFTARGAISYDATPGTDATRPLISFIDFGADVPVSAGTFTLQFNASGIATVVVS